MWVVNDLIMKKIISFFAFYIVLCLSTCSLSFAQDAVHTVEIPLISYSPIIGDVAGSVYAHLCTGIKDNVKSGYIEFKAEDSILGTESRIIPRQSMDDLFSYFEYAEKNLPKRTKRYESNYTCVNSDIIFRLITSRTDKYLLVSVGKLTFRVAESRIEELIKSLKNGCKFIDYYLSSESNTIDGDF